MRTARIVVLKGAVDVAARGAAVVTFPVMAAQAGPDGYGAYALVTTVASFVIPFASLGLGGAMVRFVGRHTATAPAAVQFARAFRLAALGAVLAGGTMALAAGPLSAALLDWSGRVELFRWGGLLVVAATLEQVLLEYLRAREKLALYVWYQLVQTLTTVGAVLLVMLWRHDVVLLVAVLAVLKAVAVLVTVAAARPAPADVPSPDGAQSGAPLSLVAMVRFGLPLTIAGFGLWLMNLSDRLVVGHYLPTADLGRYGAVFMFASLVTLVSTPLYLPAYPRLMAAVSTEEVAPQAAEIRVFHRYVALVTIPAAALLCVIIGPLATRTGGSGFHVPQSLVVMLVLALLLDQWNGLAQYLLLCHGRTVFMQNVWLGYGVLNLAVNLVVVPRYGLTGAAAVTLATFVLLEAHILASASRFVPLLSAYRLRTSGWAVAASAAASLVALPVLHAGSDSLAAIAAAGVAFALVYGLLMVALREVRVAELRFW